MIKDSRLLDTLDRRGDGHRFHSSYGFDRYNVYHRYHPDKRSDRGYFPDEFKKVKQPTFDRYLKNMEDAEAWLLVMNKLFKMHDYTENMKAIIAIFSLKAKANI